MIPVERCHDNVIALLIILPVLAVHLAFQKMSVHHRFHLLQKEHQKYHKCAEGPSIAKGEVTSFTAADQKS